ncbi:MAG: OsmC family protein [Deltaproteobacteria bacterium]|nr:MAG: OsmC family protein [Deltaproteobacteria bacterium]
MQEQAIKKQSTVNGVDVDRLFETIDVIKEKPEIGKFKFRANNKWVDGGHNRTTIKNFYGAQKDHLHENPFELDADEPPVLLGQDKGPNPVEYALKALAACVTTSLVYHAAAEGIEIRGVESRLEGDLDLRGFLGISEDVPVGYENIRMYFKIDADVSEEEKEHLIQMGQKYSPVFNTISSATPVSVQLDR